MAETEFGRPRPCLGEAPRSAPPAMPGYVQIAHERADLLHVSVVGAVLLPFWWYALAGLTDVLGGRPRYEVVVSGRNLLLATLVALVLVPVLHEAAHGGAARVCGARPAFGIGPGFAYTTFREPLGWWAYLAVGLAPLIVLSAACVALAVGWSALAGWALYAAVVNAAGAIGDLWMSWRIVRQPRDAVFVDLADGFAVFLRA